MPDKLQHWKYKHDLGPHVNDTWRNIQMRHAGATRSLSLYTVGFSVPRVALALWHDQRINTRLVEDARGTEVRACRDTSAEWCSAANCIPRT